MTIKLPNRSAKWRITRDGTDSYPWLAMPPFQRSVKNTRVYRTWGDAMRYVNSILKYSDADCINGSW